MQKVLEGQNIKMKGEINPKKKYLFELGVCSLGKYRILYAFFPFLKDQRSIRNWYKGKKEKE